MAEHIGLSSLEGPERKKSFGRFGIMLKLGIIGFLILLMLIPLFMVGGVISERQSNQLLVEEEIAASWGGKQILTGPILVVPYQIRSEYKENGKTRQQISKSLAYLLPSEFRLDSSIFPQIRKKGIFKTIIYTTDVKGSGYFNLNKLKELNGIAMNDFLLGEAFVLTGISSPQGLSKIPDLVVQHHTLELRPGVNGANIISTGVYAPLQINREKPVVPFKLALSLKGIKSLSVVPIGQQSTLAMQSNWKSPRFFGDVLPTKPEVSGDGFKAVWNIPELARMYEQVLTKDFVSSNLLEASAVGTELMTPVDFYRQVDRVIKYGVLFLVLTFATYFIFEIISNKRLHPFQYLLIGCSIILFYLLLLAFAEVIGFGGAYGIASLATIASISLYSHAILGKIQKRAALLVAGLLSVLYGYLYVLLQLEDWSLLFGAIGLFAVLATIMYITRNVDWYHEQPA